MRIGEVVAAFPMPSDTNPATLWPRVVGVVTAIQQRRGIVYLRPEGSNLRIPCLIQNSMPSSLIAPNGREESVFQIGDRVQGVPADSPRNHAYPIVGHIVQIEKGGNGKEGRVILRVASSKGQTELVVCHYSPIIKK